MTLFLAADLAAIALVTCLMLALPALAGATLAFGVRVSAGRASDPAVVAERSAYARLTVLAATVATVVSIPVTALITATDRPPAIGVTATALGLVQLALYYRAHRRIRRAKRAGGWQAEGRQGVTVDTTFRTDPVRLPWLWGLPGLAVLLVTAGLGWSRLREPPATLPLWRGFGIDPARRVPATPTAVLEPVIYQLAIGLVVLAMIYVVLRARPDLDAAKPTGSARRYRVYLRGVAVLSLVSAACLNLGLLLSALPLWEIVPFTLFWRVTAYLPIAALLVPWLIWEARVGRAGHRLPALPGEEEEESGVVQRDDDRHWFLAGAVYANRSDPALLVPARLGSSWTLNIGHPVTWLVLATALAVTALALAGVVDLPQKGSLF
ncbi:DUF5808 domain-containing protein [Nonomuraea glycinis]|uniref:DUF5808 domain-containing protein n=1 Tax=Nonomuraea glycinis TaxID=2047744 RepID=A0A918E6Q8_9ACTN|nr:DUF5808 domain-containing protein [Nonomuraea glycinis]MCA2177258.1 DUF5808 domain-containing protein [Nonomuraea glycinis]GGP08953.1 hypothetical protein GCM10012278_42620 [Nonomuraea glycinis]